MATYYHVCTDDWNGDDLLSLLDQYDNWREAEAEWERRWPEGGDAVCEHVSLIHMHDTLEQAQEYQRVLGGDIVQVTLNDPWAEEYVSRDREEYDDPVCKTSIPHQCLQVVTA